MNGSGYLIPETLGLERRGDIKRNLQDVVGAVAACATGRCGRSPVSLETRPGEPYRDGRMCSAAASRESFTGREHAERYLDYPRRRRNARSWISTTA